MLIHVVKKGDILWQIAKFYEVDINEIIRINGLTNPSMLLDGESLLIPTSGVTYTIKYGDTLWNIAQKMGVPLLDLLDLNKIINPDFVYPGVVLTIPQKPRPPIEVNAYAYVYGESDIPILQTDIDKLTYLVPFTYNITEDGRLLDINDEQAIQLALAHNVIPVMSVTNYTFYDRGENITTSILNNVDTIKSIIHNIIRTMKEKGYRGLNISFQNITAEDREAYNSILFMATSMLHAEDFFISVSIIPKFDENGNLIISHDGESLGRILDYLVLKSYDWNNIYLPPGPINNIKEIRQMLDHVIRIVPKEKVLIGYQLFAKDWIIPYTQEQQPEIISMEAALNRAKSNNAKIKYDELSQSPYFNYKDTQNKTHEVWFEDARSAQAKFDIIKEYGIRGISYWTLGYPFKQNWNLLEDNFLIVKD